MEFIPIGISKIDREGQHIYTIEVLRAASEDVFDFDQEMERNRNFARKARRPFMNHACRMLAELAKVGHSILGRVEFLLGMTMGSFARIFWA